MKKIIIDKYEFEGHRIPTQSANIILIKGKHGFLGCGYFNVETANKLQEAIAIVAGVQTFDDMLNATVVNVSAAAEKNGIVKGMSGRDALLKMA
jgi:uncharacterized protein YunC (DUF1805 family)